MGGRSGIRILTSHPFSSESPAKKQNGLIATHIRNQAVFDSKRGFRRFVSHESETLVFAKSGKTPVQNRS